MCKGDVTLFDDISALVLHIGASGKKLQFSDDITNRMSLSCGSLAQIRNTEGASFETSQNEVKTTGVFRPLNNTFFVA